MSNNPAHPLRIAITGLGESANRIQIPAVRGLPDVEIVAVCDLDRVQTKKVQTRWGIPRGFTQLDEMLAATQPDILVIATPPKTHFEACRLGLEYDCHLFCEKPFMPSLPEADQIIELARRKNRVLVINNQYSEMPIFKAVQERIENGTLGNVYHLEAWQHMYLPPEKEAGWKVDLGKRRVLFEFGTHVIDLAARFFGSLPVAVTAQAASVHPDIQSDLSVVMRVDFPGGRFLNLVFDRMSHAPIKYLEMRLFGERASMRISYGGAARAQIGWNSERGRPKLKYSLTQGGETVLELPDGRTKKIATQSKDALHIATRVLFENFVASIRNGETENQSAQFNRDILKTMLAGYQSIEEGGRLVRLDESENG